MGSRFQALLSHQGPMTHVNHAHRQCAPAPAPAPVPTGRYTTDEYGNVLSWGLSDWSPGSDPDQTPESRQSTEDLRTNLAFVQAKGRHMVALRNEAANLSPYTHYLSDQLGQLDAQIAELTEQMGKLQAELMKRLVDY